MLPKESSVPENACVIHLTKKGGRELLMNETVRCMFESGKSKQCKFENDLKMDFQDWMIIKTLLLLLTSILAEYCFC